MIWATSGHCVAFSTLLDTSTNICVELCISSPRKSFSERGSRSSSKPPNGTSAALLSHGRVEPWPTDCSANGACASDTLSLVRGSTSGWSSMSSSSGTGSLAMRPSRRSSSALRREMPQRRSIACGRRVAQSVRSSSVTGVLQLEILAAIARSCALVTASMRTGSTGVAQSATTIAAERTASLISLRSESCRWMVRSEPCISSSSSPSSRSCSKRIASSTCGRMGGMGWDES
jgi:hypothetical protein